MFRQPHNAVSGSHNTPSGFFVSPPWALGEMCLRFLVKANGANTSAHEQFDNFLIAITDYAFTRQRF